MPYTHSMCSWLSNIPPRNCDHHHSMVSQPFVWMFILSDPVLVLTITTTPQPRSATQHSYMSPLVIRVRRLTSSVGNLQSTGLSIAMSLLQ
ncbi:hypothetical protein CC80DRAFT_110159 [Byssothecium circinans]|uniref:Uncharacterized protein n=1 Tax=Byssothecium circinans TaxID=147558 RepID=A0A6A5TQ08_9PLEO|nr:hypothetical protein CC80DRAFT_110159 [Byssothecium circinans]